MTFTPIADRMPPSDVEAEAALIGAVLFDNERLADVASVVPAGRAFFRADHGCLWDAVLGMYGRGEPVDLVTLAGELQTLGRGDLLRHDGPVMDGPLGDLMARGTLSWEAPAYAERVRACWVLRETIETCNDAIRRAYARRDDPAAVLAEAAEGLRRVAGESLPAKSFRAAELLPEVYWRIQERQRGISSGVRTGFDDIDGVTDGFQPGELVVVGARPSMGKTAIALNVADHVAVFLDRPSLFVSLEMSNASLVERVAVSRARVDGHKVRLGEALNDAEWDRLQAAYDAIAAAPLYLIRRPGRTASQVANEVRMSHARDGVQVAFVDYLQLVRPDGRRDDENAALTRTMETFKGLAADLGIPVVLLSQLSRELEKREDKRPKMSDLRASGSIEQDADIVLLLHRPEYFNPEEKKGRAEVHVAKNRNGRVGTFDLTFTGKYMRFDNYFPEAASPAGPAY